jgi:CHAD domain-containing protein
MTGRNFISEAWEKEEKLFFNNLSTIRHQPSKDAVHDLRVSVKKMRAYLVLNQEISGFEYKEKYKRLKRFYAVAGKYRDTQMALSLAKKHEEQHDLFYPAFEKYQYAYLPFAEQWTKKAALEFDIADISRLRIILMEGLNNISDIELREKLSKATENKLEEAKKLSASFVHNAHEIRKLLKIVYYWLLVLPAPLLLSDVEMKDLEEILNTLGKWQDHVVLLERAVRFKKDWLLKHTKLYEHALHFENYIADEANDLLNRAAKETKLISAHFLL